MSDDFRKPEAMWEPGTLDNTRRNIGSIDKEEALRMQKILGGQIYTEKSAPIDYDALPKKNRTYAHRSTGRSSKDVASISSGFVDDDEKKSSKSTSAKTSQRKETVSSSGNLPPITAKVRNQMDRVMMDGQYKIKSDYGFFNVIRNLFSVSKDKVSKSFIEYEIKNQIAYLQGFTTSIKTLIQIAPDTYKKKIVSDDAAKFRFLKTVGNWSLQDVKAKAQTLMEHPENNDIYELSDYVKSVYRICLTIYYLGEQNIANYIKEVHGDLCKYPKANTEKITKISKESMTAWLSVYTSVIKGLYPILMRLISTKFDDFPYFFQSQASLILQFIEMTKFEIQLPQKKKKPPVDMGTAEDTETDEPSAEKEPEKTPEQLQKEKEAEERRKEEAMNEPGAKTPVVDAGLKLLEKMFPDAGFKRLEKCPDLYPYFEPIYDFEDGYNVISETNPMMVTMILITILMDIFQGMRNVNFVVDTEPQIPGNNKKVENIVTVLNEWSIYKENLFEKSYIDQMLHFVNQQYTQSDFRASQLGKKIMTDILWQTKYNFLPHFEFEQLLLEKPANDSRFRPLCIRTYYLRKTLTDISKKLDAVAKTKGSIKEIENPWQKYHFDIANPVSKRLDVLLGAKLPSDQTNATNANLIKYAMCIMSVLDWWVNNKESPAYTACDSKRLYRISPTDGGPVFSVPLRKDQNRLFAQSVKGDKK